MVLCLVASRLVLPVRRWQIKWKEALIGIGLVLLIVAITAGGFLLTADRYENINTSATPWGGVSPPAPMPVFEGEIIVEGEQDVNIEQDIPTPVVEEKGGG